MYDGMTLSETVALDPSELANWMANERSADIVEVLIERTPEEAALALLALPADRTIETLDQPSLECEPEIMAALPRDKATPYAVHPAHYELGW